MSPWWAQGTYGCQHEGGPRRPRRQKYPDCAQHLGWHPAPLHSGTCSWWCLKTCTSASKFTATATLSQMYLQMVICKNMHFYTNFVVVVVDRFLYSTILCYVILHEWIAFYCAFLNIHQSGVLYSTGMAGATWNCYHFAVRNLLDRLLQQKFE